MIGARRAVVLAAAAAEGDGGDVEARAGEGDGLPHSERGVRVGLEPVIEEDDAAAWLRLGVQEVDVDEVAVLGVPSLASVGGNRRRCKESPDDGVDVLISGPPWRSIVSHDERIKNFA